MKKIEDLTLQEALQEFITPKHPHTFEDLEKAKVHFYHYLKQFLYEE